MAPAPLSPLADIERTNSRRLLVYRALVLLVVLTMLAGLYLSHSLLSLYSDSFGLGPGEFAARLQRALALARSEYVFTAWVAMLAVYVSWHGRRLAAAQHLAALQLDLEREVAQALADATQEEPSLRRVLAAVCRVFGFARGAEWRFDEGTPARRAVWPEDAPEDDAVLASQAWQTGQPVNTGAGIAIPCRSEGRVTGILEFATRGPVEKGVLDFLATIGTQVGQLLARKAAEAERDRYRDEALALARLKSEFVATVSHEIRTPLNAILGMLDLMRNTRLEDYQRRYLLTADKSARQLLSLIEDVLDFSKIEAGKLHLEAVGLDVAQVARDAMELVSHHAWEKGLETSLHCEGTLPGRVLGDPKRLRQVLINLAGNAVKFTERGHVLMRLETPSWTESEVTCRISVEDTGIGIPPDKLSVIFEKFAQADSSTTRRFGGTGLGLSISSDIIQLMGGTIEVRSSPGEGSTFTVTLTLPRDVSAASPEPALLSPRLPRKGLEVLLAEDNKVNQFLALHYLEMLGCRVEVATDGARAVELARTRCWDLILMDCHMPVMDGYEATRRIRQLDPPAGQIPIIGLTASLLPEERERGLAAGMNDYIGKPFDQAVLAAALERWFPTRTASETFDEAAFSTLLGLKDSTGGPLLEQLLPTYIETVDGHLAGLAAALAASDVHGVELAAHALKGSSLDVGARRAAEMGGRLEKLAREGDITGAGPLFEELRAELGEVRVQMRRRIEELKPPAPGRPRQQEDRT